MTNQNAALASNVADLRIDYARDSLTRSELDPDPIKQFERWLEVAVKANLGAEANAMTLATATKTGIPSARVVLLKGVDGRGFVFYTNYESQKGQELSENPNAALVFYWGELHRQVRVTGQVYPISRTESEQYFRSRPVGSRLGAWASQQSQVVDNRLQIEDALERITQRYPDEDVPLPPFWGGYRLSPRTIEFWQGRSNRLHDRFRYTRLSQTAWQIDRLSP